MRGSIKGIDCVNILKLVLCCERRKFMRRKFISQRGVLYFGAVAVAAALVIGQVGGYSATVAAADETTTETTTEKPADDTSQGGGSTGGGTGTETPAGGTTTTTTTAPETGNTTVTTAAPKAEVKTEAQTTTAAETTTAEEISYDYDDDITEETTEEATTAAATPTQVSVSSANSASVAKTIEKLAEGSTVTVDMSSTKTISKDVLEAAKDEKVEIVLDMGTYKWSIDASSISSELHDVNMNVSFGAETEIPQDEIASVAGDDSYQTISLDYDGAFGFTASLGFNVGSDNAGKYVNLYYFNKNNELEYQNSGIVDEKGNTSVVFSHASEYLAIISDSVPAATDTSVKSPVTADLASTVPYAVLMLTTGAVMLGTMAFKKKND
jgi:hypothetical protein